MAEVRRFADGDLFEVDGIEFWVRRGKKGPDDLQLMMNTPLGWRSIRMTLGFFLADFFFENEDHLYPPERGLAGGAYYLARCRDAAAKGWNVARDRLDLERRNKARA